MHRIFCAAPPGLEYERDSFHRVIGNFNESEAMKADVLFVPLALQAQTADMRSVQVAIDSNIRDCNYYVQLLDDTWGPPPMNFERDYKLALECVSDESRPLKEVVVFCKNANSLGIPGPIIYSTAEEFELQLETLLARWLKSIGIE